jgi:hypothetical protein
MKVNQIFEMSIKQYLPLGDFKKAYSFHNSRDRMLVTNPKTIEHVKNKFAATDIDFNLFFLNSREAKHFTEVGIVSPQWVVRNLGQETFDAIKNTLNDDSITVIFTNNKGDERMPLTAWIMAHRIMHAAARKRNNTTQYTESSNWLLKGIAEILNENYYVQFKPTTDEQMTSGVPPITRYSYDGSDKILLKNIRNDQLLFKSFFHSIGTFKSARDKNLRDWFEALNELGAQYLITGRIKFNEAPKFFRYKSSIIYVKSEDARKEATEMLQMLARDMEYYIKDIFSELYGRILVM